MHAFGPPSRGAALTEFVILVPVFLAAIYGSLYLCDIGVLKLHAQEITRYTAWGMAVRPMSNYETFSHGDAFLAAQAATVSEVNRLYQDLDGQSARASGVTVAGRHVATRAQDIRNDATPPLTWDRQSAPRDDAWTAMLDLLHLRGGGAFTNSMMKPLGLDTQGLITAEASIELLPLARPEPRQNMAALSAHVGLGLTTPSDGGTLIYDIDGKPLHVTLLVDSWRVLSGASAQPMITKAADRPFANVVARVDHNILAALPLGPLWSALAGATARLPDAVNLLVGWPPELPETHVLSRPYTTTRPSRPAYNGAAAAGQVDLLDLTGGAVQFGQHGGVRLFETGPLYDDPHAPGTGPFVDAINRRGPNFMGCAHAQQHSCASKP